jgi:hypothetical protein
MVMAATIMTVAVAETTVLMKMMVAAAAVAEAVGRQR